MTLAFLPAGEIEQFGWVLVHSLWQFTLIALFAVLMIRAMRGGSALKRYWSLVTLFAVMVAAPAVTWFCLPAAQPNSSQYMLENVISRPSHVTEPTRLINESGPSLSPAQSQRTSTEVEKAISKSVGTKEFDRAMSLQDAASLIKSQIEPWFAFIVIAWCFGVFTFAMRPLFGWLAVRRLRSIGISPAPEKFSQDLKRLASRMGITQGIRLLESKLIQTPMVIGHLRPVILLPLGLLANMPVTQLESILVHELAHIRRHDYLINLLQALCETLFFYHPAIWWLSHRIRIEREHCCDDIALAFCGDKIEYGRALLSLEEMRGAASALGLGARDGSLISRVKRMLYGEPATPFLGDRTIWVACVTTAMLLMAVIWSAVGGSVSVASPTLTETEVQDLAAYQKGGAAEKGLELRVMSVAANTNEQRPQMEAAAVTKFAEPGAVTIVAELKNVSDKPIRLAGVRYGEGVSAPSIGKSNSRQFGPILFEYAFRTQDGKLVGPPSRKGLNNPFLELSGAMIEKIAPGEKVVCLLRPLDTHYEAMHWLPAGDYTLQVAYVGVNEATQAEMTKHWPAMGFSGLWNGKVSSNVIPVSIAEQPKLDLIWGPTTNGLQAAIEFRDTDTYRAEGAAPPPRHEFPLGAGISSLVHVKNVSDKPISFWTEEFRQGDSIEVTDATGKVTKPPVPFFSGWAVMSQWTLKPGEIATCYSNIGSGILASTKTRGRGGPTLSPEAISKAGKYSAEIELNFGSLQSKDAAGNPVPGPDDFSGRIKTGKTPFVVRERKTGDDPPKFTAKIQLKSKTGEAMRGGHVEVREVGGEELINAEFQDASFELREVDGTKSCYVSVRANGFEEQTFYDVELSAEAPVVLELTKATAATIRLISKGKPVAGAKARYFVRSKAKAANGPFPMKGFEGDVWATSNERGEVLLDSLQKIDPLDAKLGENVYWFYIEPPKGLAGKMVGPIRAGEKVGDIVLGAPLTVRGEVRGTPAELDQFSAEWDQPEAIVHGDGSKPWDYAVSQNLTVSREGEKMRFELTGLRPGRLRFVANFEGKSAGHEYSKRMVGPTDVVLEIPLTDSLDDLVISNKKP